MPESTPPTTPALHVGDPARDLPQATPRHPARRNSLRLWPAILILALQAAGLFLSVTPSIDNQTRFFLMMGAPAVCLLLFLVWLVGFSRVPWKVRLALPLLVAFCGLCVARWIDPSMGVPLWIYGLPAVLAGMTFGLWWAQRWNAWQQLGLAALLSLLAWAQLPWWKLEGFDGDYHPELRYRWTASPEERLVPRSTVDQVAAPQPLVVGPHDWPMFRGPAMNSRVNWSVGPLDWSTTPPRELWRQPIGPGWSSFASVGDRLFTQEQRGDSELLTCLDTQTGKLVWEVEQPVRFSDVVAGPGPRSTPTFDGGQLFALGAKALLTAHDAATGQLLWKRDLMKEVDAQLPVWGFSGSPLVVGDLVLIYAGGTDPHGLLALDRNTGETRWSRPQRGMNFSSAQPAELAGVPQILFASPEALESLDPTTGQLLWSFRPSLWKGPAKCQPQLLSDSSLIVPVGDGVGLARLDVVRTGDTWTITERWSSNALKPSFNDFVHFEGHLYGFDQNILCCISAEDGRKRWKGGRYGFGQLVLLEADRRLLIATEEGAAILVDADPGRWNELGRVQALSDKTWNHPVVAGRLMFFRNGVEAVAYQLQPGGPGVATEAPTEP